MSKFSNKNQEDLTGQGRFAWNLLVSWVSQLVLIFSGFIMPRLVNDTVGQIALGIWDFGWSFVSYLTLVGFGMGACFNRYIAKHRAAGEILQLNKVANSVVFVQIIITSVVALTTIVFYFSLPHFFESSLKENTVLAQGVVLFLGLSLAVQMLSGSARGLLTGYHRWDIHNALHAGSSLFSLSLMVLAIFVTDLSVLGMAIGYFISTITFEALRFFFAKKVCKEFKLDLRLANYSTCKEMLTFGIKSMLSNIPPILLLQTISLILVSAIGPAALAIFARPMALTKQIKTFMTKFTLMLSPTTGAMQGEGDDRAIQTLFIETTKLSFAFCLPSLGFLFIYGDQILSLWMGKEYASQDLMKILSVGLVLSMGQDTSIRILMGMNRHGKISIVALVVMAITFFLGLVFTGVTDWALTTGALLFVIPMTIVYGLIVPIYTCRQLKLSWFVYLKQSLIKPLLYITPFLVLLFYSRYQFDLHHNMEAVISFLVAISATIVIYFSYLVPTTLQRKILLTCHLIPKAKKK
jgi:O-antigen/teichoic acid export membrane protein